LSPDACLEKTIGLLEQFGGEVLASGFGNEHVTGRCVYMIRFTACGESFRLIWPVLPSDTGDSFAARRQAATMIYHSVKSRCIEAQVLGVRVAFFLWLELPDGRPACQLAGQELLEEIPRAFLATEQGE
jgi:hypothetical protein